LANWGLSIRAWRKRGDRHAERRKAARAQSRVTARSEGEMNDPGLKQREGRDGEKEQDLEPHDVDMGR
jgi:hypothetical protein